VTDKPINSEDFFATSSWRGGKLVAMGLAARCPQCGQRDCNHDSRPRVVTVRHSQPSHATGGHSAIVQLWLELDMSSGERITVPLSQVGPAIAIPAIGVKVEPFGPCSGILCIEVDGILEPIEIRVPSGYTGGECIEYEPGPPASWSHAICIDGDMGHVSDSWGKL